MDELSADLDKILEKQFAVLRKRILTLMSRREKRIAKQLTAASRTSRAPVARKKQQPAVSASRRGRKKYHSSSSESESD
jgi:hypothetical protein